ncbi:cytochrome c oxidase subunit II [Desulfogranum marinum]|jgi:cytochrome c oxidase subunit 2|uniref:cytochrome c oxidase subunit II n=1 Tax=Desulfogranum marinum TaxID=453220 RepID=UPI001965997A|nr:cytochrome c oxidase subunit II [Desulfogranum marinum]MBM9513519.1 cytochrome c oxidase subunit II [Desulfogranum marinum]
MDPVLGVDRAFWYIFIVSAIFLAGITVVMVYFVFRYRRAKHPQPADIRDNWKLELLWTVIPTIIALSMFWVGWQSYTGLRNVPAGAVQIEALGQMFSWIFIYDNDKETENELVVPAHTPIKLNIESLDVLHSFYIPAFRVKADAVKNFPTYVWFRTNEPGQYDILCAEYCGLDHSQMVAKLTVLPKNQYQEWLDQEDE